MALLLMTPLLATAVAVLLLVVHRVTTHDPPLNATVIAYSTVSLVALSRVERPQLAPLTWPLDGLATLALAVASEDWRRPFYVLMLTALILPDWMVPLVVVLALAYAAAVLKRLRGERLRSERLAVQNERHRIAWELHDSAKQRVHAAHHVPRALQGQVSAQQAELVGHALSELRSAGADMTQTSPSYARGWKDARSSSCRTLAPRGSRSSSSSPPATRLGGPQTDSSSARSTVDRHRPNILEKLHLKDRLTSPATRSGAASSTHDPRPPARASLSGRRATDRRQIAGRCDTGCVEAPRHADLNMRPDLIPSR
jgi:hypothetical protein